MFNSREYHKILNKVMETKTTFNPIKNFSQPNTPSIWHTIGDWGLRIGAIGLVVTGLPAVLPAVILATIPATIFATVGGWAVGVGLVTKLLTKSVGTVDVETGQPVNPALPPKE